MFIQKAERIVLTDFCGLFPFHIYPPVRFFFTRDNLEDDTFISVRKMHR